MSALYIKYNLKFKFLASHHGDGSQGLRHDEAAQRPQTPDRPETEEAGEVTDGVPADGGRQLRGRGHRQGRVQGRAGRSSSSIVNHCRFMY